MKKSQCIFFIIISVLFVGCIDIGDYKQYENLTKTTYLEASKPLGIEGLIEDRSKSEKWIKISESMGLYEEELVDILKTEGHMFLNSIILSHANSHSKKVSNIENILKQYKSYIKNDTNVISPLNLAIIRGDKEVFIALYQYREIWELNNGLDLLGASVFHCDKEIFTWLINNTQYIHESDKWEELSPYKYAGFVSCSKINKGK